MWGLVVGAAVAAPLRGVKIDRMPDSEGLYRRRVAVVVGIDDYSGTALDLSHAVNDAQAVARLLEDRFAFDEVVLLLEEDAGKVEVWRALDALRHTHADDAVLVYWAGHGVSSTTQTGEPLGFLVPQDGDPRPRFEPALNLSMAELRRFLLDDVPARHKLVIADACYAGTLSLRGSSTDPGATLSQLTSRPVLEVLTAGKADEAVLDGGMGGHSVFTAALLDALEDVETYTTGSELAARVQREVREGAFARGHRQTPDFSRVAGTGDFVLMPLGDPSARVPRVPARRPTASWGQVVPGLTFPEAGRAPGVLQTAVVGVRPMAEERVRVASDEGIGVQQLDTALVVGLAGLTVGLGRWRLDVDAGVGWGPDPHTPVQPAGGVALGSPVSTTGRARWMVQPVASWATDAPGDGVGLGLVAGGGHYARWSVDARASWPQPGVGAGVRVGRPGAGALLSGRLRTDLRDGAAVPVYSAVPAFGVDLATVGGVRVAVLGEIHLTALRLDADQRAWVQDPDALTVVGSGAGRAPRVTGAGVLGSASEGAGLFAAPAPGPAVRLVVGWGSG